MPERTMSDDERALLMSDEEYVFLMADVAHLRELIANCSEEIDRKNLEFRLESVLEEIEKYKSAKARAEAGGKKRYYYSVIRFCPDPVVAEFINIGIVVFRPEDKFVAVHVTENNRRIFQMFGPNVVHDKHFQQYKEDYRTWLPAEFETLKKAKWFIRGQVNQVNFTPPTTVVLSGDPDEAALWLFNRNVKQEVFNVEDGTQLGSKEPEEPSKGAPHGS
jgi:hypothetical protein